jgi:subtilisin family serine protease
VRSLLASAGVALALAAPAAAEPGRIVVGVAPDASREDVASLVSAATGGTLVEDLGPLDALVFLVADRDAAAVAAGALPGVEYAEAVTASRSLAFVPNDPLAGQQWYLGAIRAFDHWAVKPPQPPVLVAVLDSGIEASHPEFAGRIAAARSFVSTPAHVDAFGHGTIVAGEIAAALDNAHGIAGTGIPVQLLVAKVVGRSGEISVLAEARAIRWAVDRGARVINLSLGGPRDPRDPHRDTYSPLEHAAVDYATRRGVVVVAAAGNCASLACPERFASWPAALPHVLGVGALAPDGSTPAFSNRDRRHVDVAAPGTEILSTYPHALSTSACAPAGFTPCAASAARRNPRGTSFASPLVAAAAAVLLGERGRLGLAQLHSSQVAATLRRSAIDVGARGRDARSGEGRLDVAGAVAASASELPPRDRYEANDDAGRRAFPLRGRRVVEATLDRWDDMRDVYRVRLRRGQRLHLALDGPAGGQSNLYLWRPGTRAVAGGAARRANRLAAATRPGSRERLGFRARRAGAHYVEVRLVAGRSGPYRLGVAKR